MECFLHDHQELLVRTREHHQTLVVRDCQRLLPRFCSDPQCICQPCIAFRDNAVIVAFQCGLRTSRGCCCTATTMDGLAEAATGTSNSDQGFAWLIFETAGWCVARACAWMMTGRNTEGKDRSVINRGAIEGKTYQSFRGFPQGALHIPQSSA